MNADKNITKNEMRFFQNDVLTDLKKLELQINTKIANISQTLLTKTNEYDTNFNKVFENITELISRVSARKYDNERIEELLNLKNKFEGQIIENQSRISIIDKNLQDSNFKYDQVFLDNLQVPGLIGISCKFKNCRMFFESVNKELYLNQKYKEQTQKLLKEFQSKVDNKIFIIESQLNKIHQDINQICQNKMEKYFTKIDQRLEITEGIVHTSRIENSKYAEDLIKASSLLKIQWDKLENIKKEIYDKFNEELDTFKKLVDYTNRNYYNQENDFQIFKERFTQLVDYLKDFRNLNNKYKEITRNIDFTKNQKLDTDFDLENYNKIGNDIKEYIQSPSIIKNSGNNKNRRDSFIFSKNNLRNMSPIKQRRNSMFLKNKKINLDNKKKDSPKNQAKRPTNYNIKTNFNPNNVKNNNINIKALSIKKDEKNKKKLLNEIGLKNEQKNESKKKYLKIIKKQKKIVTENNIDLNFGPKKDFENIKENDNSKEEESSEDELISDVSKSSDFSVTSMMVPLYNIGEQQQEIKDIKKIENNQEKNNSKEIINDKEKEKRNSQEKINSKDNNNIKEKNNKEKIDNKDIYNIKDKISKEKINIQKNIKNVESIKIFRQNDKKDCTEKSMELEKLNSFEKRKEKNLQKENEIHNINDNEKIINIAKINNIEKNELREKVPNKKKINNQEIQKDSEMNKIMFNLKENLIDNKFSKTLNDFNKLNNSIKDKNIDRNNNRKNIINSNENLNNSSNKNRTITKSNETFKENKDRKQNEFKAMENIKNSIINSSKDIKKIKEKEFTNIKNIRNNKINLHKNKKIDNSISNSIDKINQLNDSSKQFSLEKQKKKNSMFIKDDINLDKLKEKIKKFENDKKKLHLTEYNNSKKKSIKINTEITFPQIKTPYNDLIIKDINKEKNKIGGNTAQPQYIFDYMTTTKNKFRKNTSQHFKKNKINTNNIFYNYQKSNSKEEKQKKINIVNSNREKESFKSNNILDIIDNAKKRIKKMSRNKNDNLDNNAFLTSLNNINNNYNYYYNNNTLSDNNNIINILNTKNQENEKKRDNVMNKIEFINVNIKSINHKINILEDRYQIISNQLNNIYKIVVSSYYHHKKKIHHSSHKEKRRLEKSEDLNKNQIFMTKISELYNDNEYNLKILNKKYNRTLKRIEPFLIKKFKSNQ